MEVIKIVKVMLTEEEREILEKAQSILCDFEMNKDRETLDLLENEYQSYTPYGGSTGLAIAIDLLDVILEDSREDDEIEKEEEDEI